MLKPKFKTKQAVAKRVKVTKTGKVMVRARTAQHLAARINKDVVKKSTKMRQADPSNAKNIKKLINYVKS